MEMIIYLLVGLVFSVVAYGLYRHYFLKKPKAKSPNRPHFTLKIETD